MGSCKGVNQKFAKENTNKMPVFGKGIRSIYIKTLGVKNFPLEQPSPHGRHFELSEFLLPKFGVSAANGILGVLPPLTTANE